jgi:uncharacterized OB-fold protein
MSPAFRGEVPYAVAMVELDEGVRMVGKLTRAEGVAIGQRVRARFEDVTGEVTLVRWEPDGAAP